MHSVRWLPRRIWDFLLLRNVLIQVIMSGPKPSAVSVFWMKVCFIESNAFLKSIRRMSLAFLLLLCVWWDWFGLWCNYYVFCWFDLLGDSARKKSVYKPQTFRTVLDIVFLVTFIFLPQCFCKNIWLKSAEIALINGTNKTYALKLTYS